MIRVAIFEDNKHLRETLEILLNNAEGFTCSGAYPNCKDMEGQLMVNPCDVVLMDIEMPGMNGIEATKILKQRFPHIHILIQTVFFEDQYIFNAICAGASGYMLKQTVPDKMVEAIRETYLGGSAMTASVATKVLQMFRLQNKERKKEFIDLSKREKEILALLVKGKSYKGVASACFISIDTVNTHVRHIYEKLHVHSKSEAVAKAINQKLV